LLLLDLGAPYRTLLLENIVPFWLEHGIDWQHGGVLSCIDDFGRVLSTDKYIWSQARSVWTFSALYNRVAKNSLFLKVATNSVRFLLEHGRDSERRWVYRTDRTGNVIEGAISIYSDCFAVYGLNEYYRATRDESVLELARSTFRQILGRVSSAGFCDTAPYQLPSGRRVHAIPMILTEVANELLETTGDSYLESVIARCLDEVMNRFLRPDRQLVLEYLNDRWEELPPPEGTAVMPGHAIESMWFMLHVAKRRGDRDLIQRASKAIRRHLEAGWDKEYGGIFLGIDANGAEPFVKHWDKKLWWPHTEALYALLLSYELTGDSWCLEWYQRVHNWAFTHYPIPEVGEWRQRLTRDGKPTDELVALPVKDPFHLPRAAILITQLLQP
jgi:N-acylglucosamine 2-epimerase